MTATGSNPEFEKFTGFMDKLAKVLHDELKAELDAEKAAKAKPPDQPTGGRSPKNQ